jgi:myo-inositol-1(or 4)-monophosphatase
VRSLGSATLDLAYVAMGSFDIWWEGVSFFFANRLVNWLVGCFGWLTCFEQGCWEWDVAAGICLLEEAGGLVTTANPPEDIENAAIEPVKLGGRLYLAIRPAGDKDGESAREGQERTVHEVWRRVRHLEYSRPGV